MKDETRFVLRLLVEKAHKIRDFNFDQHVKNIGLNWNAKKMEQGEWEIGFGLPDVKELDAFLLTFRLFIQKNESISFPNLHGLLRDKGLSQELQEGIKTVRRAYFDYLNSYSNYTVNLFEGHPTRLQMLETVLYGGLAHGNDLETIQRYQYWSRDDVRSGLLIQEFTTILLHVLGFINFIADLSEKELELNSV
ncbi:MAG TPA: hypothetical protein PK530_11605 [Anaerolineales bacterium]|nr:hypothetical protein [Anaerolineales bacterium]